jgi:hypothetical protein
VERKACSNSDREARENARRIRYDWKFSGDTLYLDEYFSLPPGSKWNGSIVDIDVSLPEGTVIRFVPGILPEIMRFRAYAHETPAWKIKDGYPCPLDD